MNKIVFLLTVFLFYTASKAELVGYWDFENISNFCLDKSRFGNNGSIEGTAVLTEDSVKGRYAVLLDGNSYINLFTCGGFKGNFRSGEATFAFWIKLNTISPVTSRTGLASIGCWAWPSRYLAEYNRLSLKFFLSDGETVEVNLLSQFPNTEWHHLAVTVNSRNVNSGYKIYQNGILIGEFAMNGRFGNFLQPETPRIGVSYEVEENKFYFLDGKIDDVRIYNEELNNMEIKSLYNASDIITDKIVNYKDLYILIKNWLNNCSGPDWCELSDLDQNGQIDIRDFVQFSRDWQYEMPK